MTSLSYCNDDTEAFNNPPISKRVRVCKQMNWIDEVFGVNQIMFAIWQYCEFPSCLHLASVHSTWKQRLWPHQTIPKSILLKPITVIPAAGFKKRLSRRQHQSQVRMECKSYVVKQQQSSTSITSTQVSYGIMVKHAIIRSLPARASQCTSWLKQFFASYNHLETVDIRCKDTQHSICLGSDNPGTQFKRLLQLLQSWQNSHVVARHLIVDSWSMFDDKHPTFFTLRDLPIQLNTLQINNATVYDQFPYPVGLQCLNIQYQSFDGTDSPDGAFGLYWFKRFFKYRLLKSPHLQHLRIVLPTFYIENGNLVIVLDLSSFTSLQTFHLQFDCIQDFVPGRNLSLQITSVPRTLCQFSYPALVELTSDTTKMLLQCNTEIQQLPCEKRIIKI